MAVCKEESLKTVRFNLGTAEKNLSTVDEITRLDIGFILQKTVNMVTDTNIQYVSAPEDIESCASDKVRSYYSTVQSLGSFHEARNLKRKGYSCGLIKAICEHKNEYPIQIRVSNDGVSVHDDIELVKSSKWTESISDENISQNKTWMCTAPAMCAAPVRLFCLIERNYFGRNYIFF